MNKKIVIKGILLGLAVPLFVALLFILGFGMYKKLNFEEGFRYLYLGGQLANVLRIGLLANFVLFMIMVSKDEVLARGIVVSTLVLLTVSLFF